MERNYGAGDEDREIRAEGRHYGPKNKYPSSNYKVLIKKFN